MGNLTPKVLATYAAELQYDCPACKAQPTESCVTPSGKTRAPHAKRSSQLCREPFIKYVTQIERLTCANLKDHRGQHHNAARDLRWSKGFQVDLSDHAVFQDVLEDLR